jgi:hypothetical protein
MNHPLFKRPEEPMTPEEEAKIARSLAEAYREYEEFGKKPDLQRMIELVREKLEQQMLDQSPPEA